MSVKSLDAKKQERAAALANVQQLITDGKANDAAEAFVAFADELQQSILAEAREIASSADAAILASRGVRQLTSEEREYWQEFISAAKSNSPKQAVANISVTLPKTTINAVFDDLESEHPLLAVIDFQNTTGVMEWLMHKGEKQLATWSALCAEIVKELTGDFETIKLDMAKLSAFIPVCKAMLDLGPEWLDKYVRAILSEAIAFGLEEGIINGNGLAAPIGMIRDLSAAIDPTDGYAEKTPEVVTTLDPATYGALIAKLAKTPTGRTRKVVNLFMVVNPADYYAKIVPATTYLTPMGTYVNDMLPVKTIVIQSEQMAEGKAILSFDKRYFFGLGLPKEGRIEYSDEYRFLEDERVYLTKLYGMGKPKDNSSHLLLNISGLTAVLPKVETVTATPAP